MITVSYLAIGDELLDGRVQDSNLGRLGRCLDRFGARIHAGHVTTDDRDAIRRTLDRATEDEAVDVVVVSGGLGPTRDDVTRYAAADWAGRQMALDGDRLERLKELFEQAGYTFTPNNRRQCEFPEGAEVLQSNVGTASGFRLAEGGTEVYFFPGVPSEFQWFLDNFLEPRFVDDPDMQPWAKATLSFLGPGESSLETRLEDLLQAGEDAGAEIRFLAHAPLVTMEVSAPEEEVVQQVREAVMERSGDWVLYEDDEGTAALLGRLLKERGQTVATAESCTAGWISKELTDTAGSSSWFEYGFVTYADRAKRDLLGVREATLEAHGAVSRETVREMAEGARERSEADWALAVSGIAGPGGGTPEKPVGRVHFALAGPDGTLHHRASFRDRGRDYIRRATVITALAGLIWTLENKLEAHHWETL